MVIVDLHAWGISYKNLAFAQTNLSNFPEFLDFGLIIFELLREHVVLVIEPLLVHHLCLFVLFGDDVLGRQGRRRQQVGRKRSWFGRDSVGLGGRGSGSGTGGRLPLWGRGGRSRRRSHSAENVRLETLKVLVAKKGL